MQCYKNRCIQGKCLVSDIYFLLLSPRPQTDNKLFPHIGFLIYDEMYLDTMNHLQFIAFIVIYQRALPSFVLVLFYIIVLE